MARYSSSQLVNARRAMLKSQASTQVTEFLAPLDPQDTFLEASNMVVRALHSDPKIREIHKTVSDLISRPIDNKLLDVHKAVSRPGTSLNSTLASALYMRVLEGLRTHSASGQ